MEQILNFIQKNPFTISVPLSLIAIFISYRAYRINRTRLGLDKTNLFLNFTQGIEALRNIYKRIHNLKIKSTEDISIDNLNSDKVIFEEILEMLKQQEDKLKNAYVVLPMVYETKQGINELFEMISSLKELDFYNKSLISSKIGFIYFTAFRMAPTVYPKNYDIDGARKKLNNLDFINYYNNLVFNK